MKDCDERRNIDSGGVRINRSVNDVRLRSSYVSKISLRPEAVQWCAEGGGFINLCGT